jgi:hypothetical protein
LWESKAVEIKPLTKLLICSGKNIEIIQGKVGSPTISTISQFLLNFITVNIRLRTVQP